MGVSGQLYAPATLFLGEESLAPTGHEARYAPQLIWKLWKKQNVCLSQGLNPDSQLSSPSPSYYTDYRFYEIITFLSAFN